MSNDNYNQRLKQIRDKYGSAFKQMSIISKKDTNQYSRPITTYDNFSKTSKFALDTKNKQVADRFGENKYSHTHTNSFKEQIPSYKNDYFNNKQLDSSSYLKTKTRDERLRQIQQIRQSYAQTRNNTIQEWNRQIQGTRKNKQIQNWQLRQRINEMPIKNPQYQYQQNKNKYDIDKSQLRNRVQSYSMKNQDYQIQTKLKRNYEYSKENLNQISYQIPKGLNSHRSNLKNNDKQNIITSVIRQFDYSSKNLKKQQNDTTSPIRGLMKFDSVQKKRNLDYGEKSYNLSNIDKIQERIQKILNSK